MPRAMKKWERDFEAFKQVQIRKQRSIDFRARLEANRTHVVYRCFDADGNLLYVGVTGDAVLRSRGHKGKSEWWPQVAEFRVSRPVSKSAAYRYERMAIWNEHPRYNVVQHEWARSFEELCARRMGEPYDRTRNRLPHTP